jgi:tight adherence protein B
LPDALYMLARSCRAGQNLEQALDLVGREGGAAIGPEFRRCASQIRLGLPIVTALQNMAARVRLLDMNALVSAVALHETTGGNLPLLLDRLASSARDRNHFYGFVRSATALGRLSAFAIALITPAVLVIYCFFQPNYAQTMLNSRTGLTMIGIALALEIVGGIWLYRLQKIEP